MIHEYSKLLALVYFKNQAENYDLSELRSVLGFTQIQLDELISEFFEEGYLEYNDYEMNISEKGLYFLQEQNAENHNLESENKNLSVINKEKAISLDEIYVPKGFDKKYSI